MLHNYLSTFRGILKNLGPGLLFAGTAIGTSHLVLSTRAGAEYGTQMILVIILANLLKYPFFEFGIRYTAATQETLLVGYLRQGRWVLLLYLILNIVTMFVIMAALAVVTAGLLANILHMDTYDIQLACGVLLALIFVILVVGQYRFLENLLKYIVTILFITVVFAFVMAFANGMPERAPGFKPADLFSERGIVLLVMLIGWMPTAVEASSWPSLWAVAKARLNGRKLDLKDSLREFNAGYLVTSVLALVFLGLGVLTLYGTGRQLSGQPVAFSGELMALFTDNLGNGSYWVVAAAAFFTMFSTSFTAQDAAGRVNTENVRLLFYPYKANFKESRVYALLMLLITTMSFTLISWFAEDMGFLVELATSTSFMIAPVIGFFNLRAVLGNDLEEKQRPPKWVLWLAYAGLAFLSAFTIFYAWFRWF